MDFNEYVNMNERIEIPKYLDKSFLFLFNGIFAE
jgi:hypothetical protein